MITPEDEQRLDAFTAERFGKRFRDCTRAEFVAEQDRQRAEFTALLAAMQAVALGLAWMDAEAGEVAQSVAELERLANERWRADG
ncbi:hypothetical protein [Nocardia sp. NPDC057227]|uniref:hypothetical protein n=1 Tax=Nocardia sp. NPDC057227 TaxID=3346056 RepID=UPI00363B5548